MPRDYDSEELSATGDWEASYDPSRESRALGLWEDERDWDEADPEAWDDLDDDELEEDAAPPLIIPGGAMMAHPRVAPRRRPSLGAQLFVFAVAACVLLSALFSVGYLSSNQTGVNNPFTALANAVLNPKTNNIYFWYRAQPGDTFDSIAAKFNVTQNGIFKLNGLVIDAFAKAGVSYKIPTVSNYGADYVPPLPVGANYGYQMPALDIAITTPFNSYWNAVYAFQFNAIAGLNNGATGVCPTGYTSWENGSLGLFGFINPDQPKTGKFTSRVTQRFWAGHDGMDLSTGTLGTPLYAVQTGTVIFAGYDIGGGGYTIKIAHCDYVSTSYSHMVKGSFKVKVGDNVTQGEYIGDQGDSGAASGAHVHFMIFWRNVPVDALCAFPNGLDGDSTSAESGGPYNGCPPNLNHNGFP
jgi:murein DD-endopeptidase MepM/ murein hydrolase activator NlpD